MKETKDIRRIHLAYPADKFNKLKDAYRQTDYSKWEDFVFHTICGK